MADKMKRAPRFQPGPAGDSDEFARLLAETGRDGFAPLSSGDRVEGRLVTLGASTFLVDVGQRSEGVVPREEFTEEELAKLAVGDTLPFVVRRISGAGIELSRAATGRKIDTSELTDAMRSGLPVEGKVTGENKGGLTVDIAGLRGFVPFSQVELGPARPSAEYIGHAFRFRVIEVRGKDVVLSRAALLREEQERARRELLATLEVGEVREAVVQKIERFGVFVDLGGGLTALVPGAELSWSRGDDPRSEYSEGTRVRVKILSIDEGKDRPKIAASLKQTGDDPWLTAGERFHVGDAVRGRVTRVLAFGAFVEIAAGIEGLVHVSEMSATRRVQHPGEMVRPSQEIAAVVTAVDAGARRIGLSMITERPGEVDAETRARYVDQAAPAAPGAGAMAEAFRKAREAAERKRK